MPVPLSWVWRVSNDRVAVLGAIVALNALLLIPARGRRKEAAAPAIFDSAGGRWLFTAIIGWTAACVLGTFWLIGLTGRVADVPAHDYVKHHAVMLSLERHPLPLHNIFYAAEADTPYYYYEYHYLLPAAIRTVGGNAVSIPLAFGFTAAAIAALTVAMVYLIARDVSGTMRGGLLAAACVSVVGGWDMIAVLARVIAGGSMVVTLDAWCPVAWRIHNLMTNYVWCPQHMAALLGLLLAVRLLQCAPRARWWIAIAPLLGAAVFGSSAYLAMTIFPAAAVYVIVQWRAAARANAYAAKRFLLAVGVIAVVGFGLMATQAWQYHLINQRYDGGLTVQWERFPLALLGRVAPPGPIANLLDAPWMMLVDFGLAGVACVLVARSGWSRLWGGDGTRLLLVAGSIGAVAMFTVRSDINPIDYGFRVSIMPSMIVAAMLAGILLDARHVRPWARRGIFVMIAIALVPGLAVGFYEAPVTAGRRLIAPGGAAEAGAIRFLRAQTPIDAVVQGDPHNRITLPQLVDRQMGVVDPANAHVVVFQPLDRARMARAMADVVTAFEAPSPAVASARLGRWGIGYVLSGRVERERFGEMPQFKDTECFEPVYQDDSSAVYRVLPCSDRPETD